MRWPIRPGIASRPKEDVVLISFESMAAGPESDEHAPGRPPRRGMLVVATFGLGKIMSATQAGEAAQEGVGGRRGAGGPPLWAGDKSSPAWAPRAKPHHDAVARACSALGAALLVLRARVPGRARRLPIGIAQPPRRRVVELHLAPPACMTSHLIGGLAPGRPAASCLRCAIGLMPMNAGGSASKAFSHRARPPFTERPANVIDASECGDLNAGGGLRGREPDARSITTIASGARVARPSPGGRSSVAKDSPSSRRHPSHELTPNSSRNTRLARRGVDSSAPAGRW